MESAHLSERPLYLLYPAAGESDECSVRTNPSIIYWYSPVLVFFTVSVLPWARGRRRLGRRAPYKEYGPAGLPGARILNVMACSTHPL